MNADFAVIGGGVVGLSIAYGLLLRGQSVICIDGSDSDFRASRGNFGLVWVQSKGINAPHYAQWTQHAVDLYSEFIGRLQDQSGVQISYAKTGGYEYFLDEESLNERCNQFSALQKALGHYPYERMSAEEIRREESLVGPHVVGATFYPDDGHVNPLQLLRGLLKASTSRGLVHLTNERLCKVSHSGGEFNLVTEKGTRINCGQVVLAAGLGAKKLGPMFGFKGLVHPQRGQVLVTEKISSVLNRPSLTIRQVNEGAIQIGDSKEEVGFDDHETTDVVSKIANRAIKTMPLLEKLRLVRTWGALRVMSPDGLPIYEKSVAMPGAKLVTCHSGISLAAMHAGPFIDWVVDSSSAPNLQKFSESRFD
jgi:glycine/D-amino acid oxidase-like deaminating enzyme